MSTTLKNRLRRSLNKPALAAIADLKFAANWSPATKAAQMQLYVQYQNLARQGAPLPPLADVGYRVFSQLEEDGLLMFLFAVLGTTNKTFIDLGSADGINSNCANLAINFGWHGLFIDGDAACVQRGRSFYAEHPDTFLYPPTFVQGMITRENVNQLISQSGFGGEIDLVSIDIDGNDYWVWDALECVRPRVVIIETNIVLGTRNIAVPYAAEYVYPGVHPYYHGASPTAMAALARRRGYRLVGANRFGFNTIYVRNDVFPDRVGEVSVASILRHPRVQQYQAAFAEIANKPYVEGGTPFPGKPVKA